ncbi:MAG: hypothetical protein M1826_007432 [Phylliscum demangeonii]|nr:MAG: hypothetical protein M1826_007432 [Phylliscum demangeonii]
MIGEPIPVIVYRHLFPTPRETDPPSFAAHLKRNLVPEVRAETSTFYGNFDTLESKYPGLDYTHPSHRLRLGRFTHHRRLFRAFDDLGLTKHEILTLCRWEGTLWARESYERMEHITIRDTTGSDILPCDCTGPQTRRRRHPFFVRIDDRNANGNANGDAPASMPAAMPPSTSLPWAMTDGAHEVERGHAHTHPHARPTPDREHGGQDDHHRIEDDQGDDDVADNDNDDDDDDDEELASVGVELNQRLSAAAAARERGAAGVVMDEEWEQWMKEEYERRIRRIDPVGQHHALFGSVHRSLRGPLHLQPLPPASTGPLATSHRPVAGRAGPSTSTSSNATVARPPPRLARTTTLRAT